MTRLARATRPLVLGAIVLGVLAVAAVSCDNSFYFVRGTLNGDCDPPRYTMTDGGADTTTLRKSNCQPSGAVCCRTSAQAARTSCQYPEDCYIAPFMGACATAVDCADTQTCDNGTCQCERGGPPCVDDVTKTVTCCATGESCVMGMCQQGLPVDVDGGA